MWIERPWGKMKTYGLNVLGRWTVKVIIVNPGARLSNQRHQQRSECWIALAGHPMVAIERAGGSPYARMLSVGSIVMIRRNVWHRLSCPGSSPRSCKVLEISSGLFKEDDIERDADDYGRA